jgi:hypothetical protein
MDRCAIVAIETAVLAMRTRVSPGLWPFALLGIVVFVAACGNGNGGGSGY